MIWSHVLPTFMQQLRKCKKESNRWAIFNAKNVSRSSSIRILRVAKSWWPRAAPVAKSRIIVSTRPPIYPLSTHTDHFRNVHMRVVWTYEMESIMCIDFSYIVRSIFYLVGVGSKLKESQTWQNAMTMQSEMKCWMLHNFYKLQVPISLSENTSHHFFKQWCFFKLGK